MLDTAILLDRAAHRDDLANTPIFHAMTAAATPIYHAMTTAGTTPHGPTTSPEIDSSTRVGNRQRDASAGVHAMTMPIPLQARATRPSVSTSRAESWRPNPTTGASPLTGSPQAHPARAATEYPRRTGRHRLRPPFSG